MAAATSKFVLFVDMMGFGDLVTSAPDLLEATPSMIRALGPDYDPHVIFPDDAKTTVTPLIRQFGTFHRVLAGKDGYRQAQSTLLFSDCCFMAFDELVPAFFTAGGLMDILLRDRVPIRIGLSRGSFVSARFSSILTPQSHVGASQFFGTGVVWAHQAERVKLKGFRAFVHPSVDTKDCTNHIVKAGLLPITPPLPEAAHEIDYISTTGGYGEMSLLCSQLEIMRKTAPARALSHYDETVIAMKRMYNEYPNRYGAPLPLTPDKP